MSLIMGQVKVNGLTRTPAKFIERLKQLRRFLAPLKAQIAEGERVCRVIGTLIRVLATTRAPKTKSLVSERYERRMDNYAWRDEESMVREGRGGTSFIICRWRA